MDENFSKIIYAILALLFWLGPSLLKLLKKKGLAPAARQRKPQQPADPFANMVIPNDPIIDDRDETYPTDEQLQDLLTKMNALKLQIDDLNVACKMHLTASSILPIIQTKCTSTLQELNLKINSNDKLTSHGADQINAGLYKLERRINTLNTIVAQRTRPDTGHTINAFDEVIQSSLSPLLLHTRRMNTGLKDFYGIAAINTPELSSSDAGISMVLVDPEMQTQTSAWTELTSNSAQTFFNNLTQGKRQVYSEVGLPDAKSTIAYFLTTGRLSPSALAAWWLPEIFADTVASLQLGPGFAASLSTYIVRSNNNENAFTAEIDNNLEISPIPNHLRMNIACIVLRRMGYAKESETRFNNWNTAVGTPENIILKTGRFADMLLPTEKILKAIEATVNALLDRPLSILGGYPLAQIPELLANEHSIAKAKKLARILKIKSTISTDPLTALSAMALAIEANPQYERRIKEAAIEIILGETQHNAVTPHSLPTNTSNLNERFASSNFWVKAVATSALLSRNR